MRAMLRRLFLVFLFLLVQAGALAHGLGHATWHGHEGLDHERVCALCLAFSHVGTGMAGALPAWGAPAAAFHFHAAEPAAAFFSFRSLYLSRAPPV